MSKQQREALDTMLRGGPLDLGGDIGTQRHLFAELMSHMPPADDVVLTDGTLGGIPTVTVTAGADQSAGTILYFHGGAYAIGTARLAAGLTADLARRTSTTAVSVDYSLAPEAPFPTAINEAIAAYKALLTAGTDPSRIVFAGESAGGGLAVATASALRDHDLPQPAGIYAASPWVDLTLTGNSATSNQDADPSVTADGLRVRVRDYIGDGDPKNPLVSPVFADLRGLAPLMLQVGGNEVLLDDSTRLATQAAAAGVHVHLEVVPDVPHVFVSFAGILNEADLALTNAATFITGTLARPLD